jgi:hypothetical protein
MRRVYRSSPALSSSDSRVDPARAKALNEQIMRVARMLPGGTEHGYAFTCECGCGGLARRTGPQFEQDGGAWLDGHRERDRCAAQQASES